MHPGTLVPDVGLLKEILVEAAIAQGFLKEGFMGTWGASGNHHSVEILLLDDIHQLSLGVCGAGEKVVLDKGHVGKSLGVFNHFRDPDHTTDVYPAVTDEDTDTRLFSTDITLFREGLLFHQSIA